MCKYILVYILFAFCSCQKSKPQFVLLSMRSTHVDFKNKLVSTPELNILKYLYFYNGAGVAVGDFNGDNLPDLYFTANQTEDKLFLNNGNFTFTNITEQAGIVNNTGWTNGVTTVDINNDGLLDLYICKTGDYLNIEGHNLLFVNQGNKNGVPFFKEESENYGLNFKGFSTQAVFFDYDLDQDLDVFLLNHSVHPNRTYGNAKLRETVDSLAGDKLFENINGMYKDMSSHAGIFQSNIGFGLGVSIKDINDDGYPDIYVGNDFFENDYLYINQKDKTFKDAISNKVTSLGHTTHYSMGNSINDINNDGLLDIISLDMLPEDIKTYKTSGLEFPFQTYNQYLKSGYSPQYMQNTLHLNRGNVLFSEIASLSGIAATEWSWCPLVADFDNDGYRDLYITNGIIGATNDMDFINFISNEKIQRLIDKGMGENDLKLIDAIPQKKAVNYFYKNNQDGTFNDVTNKWTEAKPSFSNGATYADLDNDGDLDIVVNNVNDYPYILENTLTPSKNSNYLKMQFKGPENNKLAIGTKVNVYIKDKTLTDQNFTTNGYLSAREPKLYFGLGQEKTIDSLEVFWSNGNVEKLKNITSNQELVCNITNAVEANPIKTKNKQYLKSINPLINFKHKETECLDFNINPLIPYAKSNMGPDVSVADINNDGLDDIFITGGKTQASQLFIQNNDGTFNPSKEEIFKDTDVANEMVSSLFFDANNDGYQDLIVVSGGNEYTKGNPLKPILYLNNKGILTKSANAFANIQTNASTVKAVDIDNDGDLDISITSNAVPRMFGETPNQYIFRNDGKGNFEDITNKFAKTFQNIGNVEDIIWVDINNDTFKDAIVVGYWMPISVFINNNGESLVLQIDNNMSETNGWWNCVKAADFDNDGDIDIIAGNWGLNTRLKATNQQPIKLFNNDFDDNGSTESVITYYYNDIETTFSTKDELVKKLPYLNKKYLSYSDFANAEFDELFSKNKIESAQKKEVKELATCYFENSNGHFLKTPLPLMAQISSVNDILIEDFDHNGFLDVLLVGNNYEINTQLGRLDASHGSLFLNHGKQFQYVSNQETNISGAARNISKIKINNKTYYIISRNNDEPIFLLKND